MEAIERQITTELRRLQPIIEEITGLSSRWNGIVELVPDAEFKGKKPFSCSILLDADLAGQEVRWRTSLHELLHSVSAGYNQPDYNAFLGWEEGVVEQLQRIIRQEALGRLGLSLPDELFQRWETVHPFNRHIVALEQIRTLLARPDREFYVGLLQTPIRQRPVAVFEAGNRLPGAERIAFVRTYSVANAVLRR
jgi:hypothetical protein